MASALTNALCELAPGHVYTKAGEPGALWNAVARGDGALLCVTPAAAVDEQIFFDLGRLQAAVGSDGFVAPVLLDLSPEDLAQTPLAIFQCTRTQRTDLEALVADLQRRLEPKRWSSPDAEAIWEDLLQQIGDVPGCGVHPIIVTLLLPQRPVSFGFDSSGRDVSWKDSVGAALTSLSSSPLKPPPFDVNTLAPIDVETSRWIDFPRRLSRITTSHLALASPAVVEQMHGDARLLARHAREEAARFSTYGDRKVMPWKFMLMDDDKLILASNVR
jgi:hypothetical protein